MQNKSVSRIHVTGGAASGKSTFARSLGAAMKLPVLTLDSAAFRYGSHSLAYIEQRDQLLAEATKTPAWVSEGSFVGWAKPFMELADLIVFFDVSAAVAHRRIVQRHIKASLRRDNPYKGIRQLFRFLGVTRGWYSSSRTRDEQYGVEPGTTGIAHLADLKETLKGFGSKVVVCRTNKDAQRLLEQLVANSIADMRQRRG
jgi:hypothetical protein